MIVTCPSCSSKYRVRDEAVPVEGAELQCPTCSAVFMAHAPKVDVGSVTVALERMTRARDAAEVRVAELERALATAPSVNGDDAAHLARAREEMARAEARASAAESTNRRLTDELAKARLVAGDQSELLSVKQALFDAQRKHRTNAAELDVANALVASLQADISVLRANNPAAQSEASKKIAILQVEIENLRAEQSMTEVSTSSPSGLIAAVGPMLWGLEQSISYLEQFAGNEATLAGHVKQLRLLQKVLARLSEGGS
ncbi:MAG: zinc-ribbon domain-containing protein [Deltaproteobacteria bacterium]|nr:zinc-ribbon domain-containing protein [Deltaproteobacteria bacterium]